MVKTTNQRWIACGNPRASREHFITDGWQAGTRLVLIFPAASSLKWFERLFFGKPPDLMGQTGWTWWIWPEFYENFGREWGQTGWTCWIWPKTSQSIVSTMFPMATGLQGFPSSTLHRIGDSYRLGPFSACPEHSTSQVSGRIRSGLMLHWCLPLCFLQSWR